MASFARFPIVIRDFVCLGLVATSTAELLLPFTRQAHSTIRRRDDGKLALGSEAGFAYVVNASVGTPAQTLGLAISPSLGESWVPDADTDTCNPLRYYLDLGYNETDLVQYEYFRKGGLPTRHCVLGDFNRSASSTYLASNFNMTTFQVAYVDGSRETGINFTDMLTVGDIALTDYPMGLIEPAHHTIGVLGLGLNRTSWANSGRPSSSPPPGYDAPAYDNFLDRLVRQGKSSTLAYSMWLDDESGSSGNLLFGAVDTAKFQGSLKRLNALNSLTAPGSSGSSGIEVVAVTVPRLQNGVPKAIVSRSKDSPFSSVLDPSAVFSYWPQALTAEIAKLTGALYNESWAMLQISCDAARDSTFQLSFRLAGAGDTGTDGPVLDVHLADLIVTPATAAVSLPANYAPEHYMPSGMCFFGIQNRTDSSPSAYYTTGASLLRRSYLVFDNLNREVGIAPVKFHTTESSIVAFKGYGAVIPASEFYCSKDEEALCRNPVANAASDTVGSSSGSSVLGDGMSGLKITVISVALGLVALLAAVALQRVWTRTWGGKRVKTAGKQADAESHASLSSPPTPDAPPLLPAIRPQRRITENFGSSSERASHATTAGSRLRGLSHAAICREANRAFGKGEGKGE